MKKSTLAKKLVLFIVGPTASGKTGLAIMLSKKIDCEIISCDSMQVYKGIDILSAKPSKYELKKIKHHMIDEVSPQRDFNVASYRKKANLLIKSIHKKNKIPIFVGGSGLYVSAVLDGVFEDAPQDGALRARLYNLAEKKGKEFLHKKLSEIDQASSSKIHPNDLKRVVRALEVFYLTDKPMSEIKKYRRGILEEYNVLVFGLFLNRDELYKKSDERVDEMFKRGAVAEVKNLLKKKLSRTAVKAIGISQIKGYINGEYDIDEAKRILKRDTRHYAKRQLTWFRRDKRIIWVNAENKKNALKFILGGFKKACP